jgi:hypothetical protein
MFPRATAFSQAFTARPAATVAGGATSCHLRLRWIVRNGQLMARWKREPRDLSEGRASTVSHVARDARQTRLTSSERSGRR